MDAVFFFPFHAWTGGGLGKDGGGITKPVEAMVRPRGLGLGAGDFDERQDKSGAIPKEKKDTGSGEEGSASTRGGKGTAQRWRKSERGGDDDAQQRSLRKLLETERKLKAQEGTGSSGILIEEGSVHEEERGQRSKKDIVIDMRGSTKKVRWHCGNGTNTESCRCKKTEQRNGNP